MSDGLVFTSLPVVVDDRPVCFGGYEQGVCTGRFCAPVFDRCREMVMTKKKTVEIVAKPGEEPVLCEVAVGRMCAVCTQAEMAIFRRTPQGANEIQHLRCPRCDASSQRMVSVQTGQVVQDADQQRPV